jgi:hypothetical protein
VYDIGCVFSAGWEAWGELKPCASPGDPIRAAIAEKPRIMPSFAIFRLCACLKTNLV